MIYKHHYQVLKNNILVSTNSLDVYEAFKYVSLNVVQDYEITDSLEFEINSTIDGRFLVQENGTDFVTFLNYDFLIEDIVKIINTKALDAMSSHIRIHSGSASYNGNYFLVVGDAYAGKSTFMTSLVFNDFDVHGDELTLLENGKVITYPRNMYIRDTSLKILPQLNEISSNLPFVWNTPTLRIFAFDPTIVGKKWQIKTEQLTAIFFLHKNHGNESRLEICPKFKMVEQVVKQSTAPIQPNKNWISDLCNTINSCKTFDLHIGELDQASSLIKKALTEK